MAPYNQPPAPASVASSMQRMDFSDAVSMPNEWSPEGVTQFRGAVLAHYRANARDLPWRIDANPYAVLVSEVMLQQTKVEAVVPYFTKWMERFPTIEVLAAAELHDVLRLWEGLGYYQRARNLHRTARVLTSRYQGRLPEDPALLRTLPGIGPYTSGAIASIAFDRSEAAVDGNVRRVLARLLDAPNPSAGQLHHWAQALLDPTDPGGFNQGLMEIGATICTPRSPDCKGCPVSGHCLARRAGTQLDRPLARTRKPVPQIQEVVAILRPPEHRDHVLLRRRPPDGLLGGMWEFPGTHVDGGTSLQEVAHALVDQLIQNFENVPTVHDVRPDLKLEPVDHAFTHRRVRYVPFLFQLAGGPLSIRPGAALRWVGPEEIQALPVPVAQRKLASQLHPSY